MHYCWKMGSKFYNEVCWQHTHFRIRICFDEDTPNVLAAVANVMAVFFYLNPVILSGVSTCAAA